MVLMMAGKEGDLHTFCVLGAGAGVGEAKRAETTAFMVVLLVTFLTHAFINIDH